MSRSLKKFRVRCNTDNRDEMVWGLQKPTNCPVNHNHDVDLTTVTIVDKAEERGMNVTNNMDAFGRFRVSNPYMLFGFHYNQYNSDTIFTTKVDGSGLVVKEKGCVGLFARNHGDKAVFQSREYIPYQPGLSRLCYFTGVLNSHDISGNGFISRFGVFDDYNDKTVDSYGDGHFFELKDGVLAVVERSSTKEGTLHQHDERVLQSAWNIDPLDGTGESGIQLNPAKGIIFVVNIGWLGLGDTRMGVVVDSQIYWCHKFIHTDFDRAYTRTAKLPLRYEVQNNSGAWADYEAHFMCCSIQSEGGFNPKGHRWASHMPIEKSISKTGDVIAILKLKDEHCRNSFLFRTLELYSTSVVFIRVVFNPSIQFQTTPVWETESDHSIVDYTTSSAVITGGRTIYSSFVDKKITTSFSGEQNHMSIPMVNANIEGESDAIVIEARTLGGTSDVSLSMSWIEVY